MAQFYNQELSLAFDIYGCPQRCRHCWLGDLPNNYMNVEEVIDTFLRIKQEQEAKGYYGVQVKYFSPDVREPHFGRDYEELYARTDRMNGCKLEVDKNYELLSLWRLAHDFGYAKWAKERGIKRCQLKVFGLEKTSDYFHGRKGAHRDLLLATNRLLDQGMIPRWQVYLNQWGVKELDGVLDLVCELNLWERVQELGEPFNIHLTTFDSEGNGFKNHNLRINSADKRFIPKLLWQKTLEHFGEDCCLMTESEWIQAILAGEDRTPMPKEHNLFFFVTSDWEVYPNLGEVAPWWRLGNLQKDPWLDILSSYKNNIPIGLRNLDTLTNKELATRYGDVTGDKLFMNVDELVGYYLAKANRWDAYGPFDHTIR